MLPDVAQLLARRHLAEALPRRWQHVQAVARAASEISKVVGDDDASVLVAAAWLHDIGYAPHIAASGFILLTERDTCVVEAQANGSADWSLITRPPRSKPNFAACKTNCSQSSSWRSRQPRIPCGTRIYPPVQTERG